MKKVLGCLRRADKDFGLIEDGDRIAVGVSGGKDSLLLLKAMKLYLLFSKKKYTLTAITIDMGGGLTDTESIARYCEELEVPYVVRKTDIGSIIFETRKEKNPCALCSKMRRGAIARLCAEEGFNKAALGHHREDVTESFLMSMFYEGRLRTFSPKTYLDRSGITVIRPFVYLPEKQIIGAVNRLSLPVVASACPANGNTQRQYVKDFLTDLNRVFPDAKERIAHAIADTEQYQLWK